MNKFMSLKNGSLRFLIFIIVGFSIFSCNGVGTAKFLDAATSSSQTDESPVPSTPPEPSIFSGLDSITDKTDTTLVLHWTPSIDAVSYHLYEIVSGTPYYTQYISDPASSSIKLYGLTPAVSHTYRLRMQHVQGINDTNTHDLTELTNYAPDTPSTPSLYNPLTASGTERRPTFNINGVKSSDIVKIFADPNCAVEVGSSSPLASGATSVQIQVANSLADGPYLFTANSTNSSGHVSNCSGAVSYEVFTPLYYVDVVSGSATLAGAVSMTKIVGDGSYDDAYVALPALPFAFYMAGTSFTNFFVGSNTYITAGSGAGVYSGLSGNNPALPKFFLGSADNSYQRVYHIAGNNYFRVLYEGTASTSGTPGFPNIVFEFTFFKPIDNKQVVQVVFGVHARNTGVFGVASNSNFYVQSGVSITQNSSYVFVSNTDGTSWTMHAGSRVIGNGLNE